MYSFDKALLSDPLCDYATAVLTQWLVVATAGQLVWIMACVRLNGSEFNLKYILAYGFMAVFVFILVICTGFYTERYTHCAPRLAYRVDVLHQFLAGQAITALLIFLNPWPDYDHSSTLCGLFVLGSPYLFPAGRSS